tara:strand:- start:141 stop:398 length:258 start_codon:yes stop_codon:yes gene_type:complete
MKDELSRLGMQNLGSVIVVCQFLGAAGLLLGFLYAPLWSAASLGLTLLMLCGLAVRIKSKDSLWVSLPALFYMVLNVYIFFYATG